MKKLAIAGAAVALAAMPMVGAFADVTDTVILTIQSSCTVGQSTATTGAGKTMTEANAQNSHLYTFDADGTAGGTIKVTCNDASGWHIKAVGAGTGSDITAMAPQTNTNPDIDTGTDTSGDSQWAFKVAAASGQQGVTIASPYNAFAEVPATATKVASGTAPISEGAINTGYQVWVSATQPADTYTGKVLYTVATGVGN